MPNDFDQFPIYDPLIKPKSIDMSDIWVASISTFYQNIIAYLTSSGIFIPQLTTAQRDALQSPQEGQMIYNITVAPGPPATPAPQIFQTGVWKTFTTT